MKFAFIKSNRQVFDLGVIYATFGVTPTGFYAWDKRPDGKRAARQRTRAAGPLTQDLIIVGSDGDGRPGPDDGPGGRSVANLRPVLTGNICPADFDGDGAVDFFDYDGFVVAFEAGC